MALNKDADDRAASARLAARWVAAVQRRTTTVLVLALLLGAALAVVIARQLSVDTSADRILSPELPWRQAERELIRQFPNLDLGLAVVIDAPSAEQADAVQRRLVDLLRQRRDLFPELLAPETDPYFRRNGLLYLGVDELERLSDQLNLVQPFLGLLGRDPSLRGISRLLVPALQEPEALPLNLDDALSQMAGAVGAAVDGREQALSWQSLLGAQALPGQQAGSGTHRRLIGLMLQPDYRRLMPAATAIEAVRELVRREHLDADGVSIRLTGGAALEHEEMQSAFDGVVATGLISLVLVAVLLYLALRSARLVICALLTLVYGLLVTSGFAAIAVGSLNLISLAFGLLYVGLGIGYALYLGMQYVERGRIAQDRREALMLAAGDVGGFMLVCALTTSTGFFAFVPTDFKGIGELGLIAGVGMFVSLTVTLTLLPALMELLRVPLPAPRAAASPRSSPLSAALDWPYRYPRLIWIACALLGLAAASQLPRAYFDSDPLHLRDPQSESVRAFRDLLADPSAPPLTLSVLSTPQDFERRRAALAALPEVSRAYGLPDFVPADQDDKLPLIEDLALSLTLPDAGDVHDPSPAPVEREAAAALARALDASAATPAWQALSTQLVRLQAALAGPQAGLVLARLHHNLFDALPAQLQQLREALQAQAVGMDDIPPFLAGRYRSAEGLYRIEVWPRERLETPETMAQFVDAVRRLEPEAVGAPISFLEAGRTVVRAFQQAFVNSLVAVVLLLLLMLRSLADSLRVLLPLLLAGTLTVGLMVLIDQPFNFANVIALPLLLGVGVDYGVYLVQRGRRAPPGSNLLRTSTARAVWYGALITIVNFGNLMLSSHPGTASMGRLLAFGLAITLLCTLVLLPTLLVRRSR